MIIVDQEPLLAALRLAAPIADPKSPIAACANVLLRAANGKLTIAAHSTPSQLALTVAANGNLDLTLPARQLLDVVGASKGDVRIDDAGEVKSGRSTWRLPTLQASDFPMLPQPPKGEWIKVAGDVLRGAVESVLHAITDDSGGVHIEVRDGALMVMGIHPHGCARTRVSVDAECSLAVFIPRRSAIDLARFADGAERVELQLGDRLFVRVDERLLSLSLSNISLPARVLEELLSKEPEPRFDADRAALIGAIERVCLAGGLGECVEMIGKGSTLTLRSSSPKGGTAEEDIEIKATGDFKRGATGRKLVDALKSFDDETVSIWPAREIRLAPLGRKSELAAIVMERMV
jgi:DNA polymerase III sliding clamp (beta) subunit (PCNA family)